MKRIIAVSMLVMLFFSGCGSLIGVAGPTRSLRPTTDRRAVAAAANTFGVKLFRELSNERSRQNVVIAPAGMAVALFMAYDGAAGETAREMGRTLAVSNLGSARVNKGSAMLQQSFNQTSSARLTNSMWVDRRLNIRAVFVQDMKRFYSTQLFLVQFGDPAIPKAISSWVERWTFGEVPSIITNLDKTTRLILVDAEYFKGMWSRRFAVTSAPMAFSGPRGKELVPAMEQSGNYEYLTTRDFQAIELPYEGGRTNMYVFLPTSEVGLGAFSQRLQPEIVAGWFQQFRGVEGRITMPRFTVKYRSDIVPALFALGMRDAFSPSANFARIVADRSIYIQHVWHATAVKVDERGTEAGAGSAVEFHIKSIIPHADVTVDHPFVFIIRDSVDGEILFMGSVFDPRS